LSTTTTHYRSSYPTSMSQNNTHILYVGLDVAKLALQLHLANRFYTLTNDPKGHAQLLKHLRSQPQAHVVCEATGGYEQRVVRALQAAGILVSILEAGRVRHFARAQGLRAKTDPIDAAVLSEYGQTFQPAPTPPVSPQQQQLADWSQRRQQLIDLIIIERNHAEHYTDTFRCRQSRQLLRLLEKQVDHCDQAIATLIAQDPQLAHKASRLQAIPGVGPVVAATILAEMPELGTLNKQTAAALAGVAPYNRDSGNQKGLRSISGGRRAVRKALYMVTLNAMRYDRILKEFYQRLCAAGKKPLVAMTACMRKLIILMNRLLKNDHFQLAS
jgi:transposase